MSDFHREDRYIVIKRSDMDKATGASLRGFKGACRSLHDSMLGNGAPARSFLVIEGDWPEYEPVWQMIEARMNGEPNALDTALAREAALREELETRTADLLECGTKRKALQQRLADAEKLLIQLEKSLREERQLHYGDETEMETRTRLFGHFGDGA